MRSPRLVLTLAAALVMSPVRQPATAAEVHAAAYQRGGLETFSGDELIASGHHFFGTASKGLALALLHELVDVTVQAVGHLASLVGQILERSLRRASIC